LTSKHEFNHQVKLDVEARVRQGVKAVLEEVLQEEMTQHLEAGYRELTPTRRGERNGHYQRNLVTPAGKIERLEVPRDREGEFVTEVFERYKRMTGDVEEAVLEMYLCGISVRKIAVAKEFVGLYGKRFPKAVSVFEAGIEDALTYLRYPGSHHARIRTTNMLERLFREVKRRTRVVGVFPNEASASTLATEIALRSSEQWALKRYLTMDALEAMEKPNPQLSRH
jgi:transposase-like protein